MISGQVCADMNEQPAANNRMLSYTYNKDDLFYAADIRRNAPEPRTQTAFEQLYENAENGDADSNFLLYKLYICESNYNYHYEKNPLPYDLNKANTKRALYFLNKTLDLNRQHPLALEAMGVIYGDGVIQKKDLHRAVYFYDRAAESGNLRAAHRLFEMYIAGYENIPKDVIKARHYSQLASKFGSEIHKQINDHWDETLKHYEAQ